MTKTITDPEDMHQLWRIEFSDAFRPPQEILEAVERHELTDTSWHNDICPSFESHPLFPFRPRRLWVNPEDKALRELGPWRYLVSSPECDGTVFYAGDDLAEALRVLLRK